MEKITPLSAAQIRALQEANDKTPIGRRKEDAMKKQAANTPLRAFVSDNILTVQIGVKVLEWASRPENGGTLESCKVDRRRRIEWAKDVISEMTREDEVGNSPLTQFLDDMMDKAADNGSAALCRTNRC